MFSRLRAAILAGELRPGAKINEPLLSKEYGISRGPLREAIRRLEGSKLVEIRPNAGARVVALSLTQAIEIYQIRETLEGLACRLAATEASPEEQTQLRNLLDDHESWLQARAGEEYAQEAGDLDFHFRIVKLSRNAWLFRLLCEELYDLLRLYRSQTSSQPSRPSRALQEHRQIVDAILERDGELAELLMRRHIAAARMALEAQLAEDTPEQIIDDKFLDKN